MMNLQQFFQQPSFCIKCEKIIRHDCVKYAGDFNSKLLLYKQSMLRLKFNVNPNNEDV
jgi:hypothetical protein